MVEKARAIRAAVQRLESLARSGVAQIPKRSRLAAVAPPPVAVEAEKPVAPPQTLPVSAPSAIVPAAAVSAAPGADDNRAVALAKIQLEVAGCQKCRELADTRKQTVFGDGSPHARLVFLGEAPGADEDAQGIPFVGRAGQLLNKIIEACGMKREEVYILNPLKCRPPGNRTPAPDEIENCRPFLEAQLDAIQPEFICCLGAVAVRTLLDMTSSLGKMRGRVWNYRGIKVVCTYHPAYLLRNPAAKRDVWEDMKFLMAQMGRPIPEKG